MVAYELSLLVKSLPRPRLVEVVKRTAESIISNHGHIEKIDYLGIQQLPRKMLSHSQTHKKGSYFVIHYHCPFENFENIKESCVRDLDVIRPMHVKKTIADSFQCKLDDEIKPPAYRSEVELMMKEAKERLPKNIRKRQLINEQVQKYPF